MLTPFLEWFWDASDTDWDGTDVLHLFAICYAAGAAGIFFRKYVLLSGLCVAVENTEHLVSVLEGNEPKHGPDCAMAAKLMAIVFIL